MTSFREHVEIETHASSDDDSSDEGDNLNYATVRIIAQQRLWHLDLTDVLRSYRVDAVRLQLANHALSDSSQFRRESSIIKSSRNTSTDWDPSGVTASMVRRSSSLASVESDAHAMQAVLRQIMAARLWLAPLATLSKSRLERYHHHHHTDGVMMNSDNRTTTTTVILPTELSPASAESFRALADAAGDCSRMWSADWSSAWLAMNDADDFRMIHRKRLGLDLVCHHHGDTKYCTMALTLEYAVPMPAIDNNMPLMKDLFPFEDLPQSCGWADESTNTVQINGGDTHPLDDKLWHSRLPSPIRQSAPLPMYSVRVGLDQTNPWDARWWIALENNNSENGVICDNATATVMQDLGELFHPIWSKVAVWRKSNINNNDTSMERDNHNHKILRPSTRNDPKLRISWETWIPSQSIVYLSVPFAPRFLGFEELTGDPNRGLELPPAKVVWTCPSSSSSTMIALTSESILYLPPMPDCSMPFNVLSLTCTLFAFVLGSLVNLLVRRASNRVRDLVQPELRPPSPKGRLKAKLKALKDKLRKKTGSVTTD